MKIKWIGLRELTKLGDIPSNYWGGDMYAKRRCGEYLVSWGVDDGWGVRAPFDRGWRHDGKTWVQGTSAAPPRGKVGAVTLEQARLFAETIIAQDEAR